MFKQIKCPKCGDLSLLELDNDNQFPEPLRYMCDCGFEMDYVSVKYIIELKKQGRL